MADIKLSILYKKVGIDNHFHTDTYNFTHLWNLNIPLTIFAIPCEWPLYYFHEISYGHVKTIGALIRKRHSRGRREVAFISKLADVFNLSWQPLQKCASRLRAVCDRSSLWCIARRPQCHGLAELYETFWLKRGDSKRHLVRETSAAILAVYSGRDNSSAGSPPCPVPYTHPPVISSRVFSVINTPWQRLWRIGQSRTKRRTDKCASRSRSRDVRTRGNETHRRWSLLFVTHRAFPKTLTTRISRGARNAWKGRHKTGVTRQEEFACPSCAPPSDTLISCVFPSTLVTSVAPERDVFAGIEY